MDRRDKISDIYSKRIAEVLDNQSENDLFIPLTQNEQDEIWEEITNELDIAEVWNDISSDLDILMPVDSGSGIFVKCLAAILIILIGLTPVNKEKFDTVTSQQQTSIENKQNDQPAEAIITDKSIDADIGKQLSVDISPSFKSTLKRSKKDNIPELGERNRIRLIHAKPLPISNESLDKLLPVSETDNLRPGISWNKTVVEKSVIPTTLLPYDLESIKLFPETNNGRLKTNYNSPIKGSQSPASDWGRISGGLVTSFKNTWLLNNETFEGLKSESLNATQIVFFPDVGLSLNYSLNKIWLLQADGFLNSNTGQVYYDYIYGHYSKKRITLRYSTVSLSVKYKLLGTGNFMSRSSINLLAGGYFSVLHQANLKINTDIENIRSQYERFDFGISLGGELEFRIFDRLSLAPGLFMSLGIPDISKGTSNSTRYILRTHNGSAGFHLTFYYHFD